jgi:hypothetical protein
MIEDGISSSEVANAIRNGEWFLSATGRLGYRIRDVVAIVEGWPWEPVRTLVTCYTVP